MKINENENTIKDDMIRDMIRLRVNIQIILFFFNFIDARNETNDMGTTNKIKTQDSTNGIGPTSLPTSRKLNFQGIAENNVRTTPTRTQPEISARVGACVRTKSNFNVRSNTILED